MCTNPLDFYVLNQPCKEFIKLFISCSLLIRNRKKQGNTKKEKKKKKSNKKKEKNKKVPHVRR